MLQEGQCCLFTGVKLLFASENGLCPLPPLNVLSPHIHLSELHAKGKTSLEFHILHLFCNLSFGDPFTSHYWISIASVPRVMIDSDCLILSWRFCWSAVSPHSLLLCLRQEWLSFFWSLENLSRLYHWTASFGNGYPVLLIQVSSVNNVLCESLSVFKALKTLSHIYNSPLAWTAHCMFL